MDKQKRTKSADERLHDTTGGDVKGDVVYDHEPNSQKQANELPENDEQSAESFPASDTPAHSDPTSSIGRKDKDK